MRQPGHMLVRIARRPIGLVGLLIVAGTVAVAVVGPPIWGTNASTIHTTMVNQGPSSLHWFGTDALGRDIFARVMVATRLSLVLALLASLLGLLLGILLGSARILLGAFVGRAANVLINVTNAFPGLLMLLFFAAVFGVNTVGAVLALAIASAPTFARLTWTLTASVEKLGYVEAARVSGISRLVILVRHVLPNVAETLILNGTLAVGGSLLAFGGLSFLGIGIQPPQYDFGRLLNDGTAGFYTNPLAVLGPAAAVIIAGLGFNLLGEALAHAVSRRTAGPAGDHSLQKQITRNQGLDPDDAGVVTVEDLEVSFGTGLGHSQPVRGVSMTIAAGDSVGVVGESGSGKSLTALAIADLIDAPGHASASRLEFDGNNLRTMPAAAKSRLLGTSLAVVFQNPMTSFNPIRRIGPQLTDSIRVHRHVDRKTADRRAVEMLDTVGITEPDLRAQRYPFEFSGGMQQRAMIAMGVMGRPKLIIADEPTTALDVTTQSRVLKLLKTLCEDDDVALLLISHDITVIRRMTRRVLVMYAGRIVEDLPSADLDARAAHPYTRALLRSVPDLDTDRNQPLAVIPGRAPEPGEITAGCPFAPRCPRADDHCRTTEPKLERIAASHALACWHPENAQVETGLHSAEPEAGPTTTATQHPTMETLT